MVWAGLGWQSAPGDPPWPAMSDGQHSTTVHRLERKIRDDHSQAVATLHHQLETVVASLLAHAKERGYAGSDPLGAIGTLIAPDASQRALGEATVELWRTFFRCFREDEKAFEAARFRQEAAALDARIEALQPGDPVDHALARDLVDALTRLWEERHQSINERLDTLIKDLSAQQARLGSAQLDAAHVSDELGRTAQAVLGALAALNDPPPAGENLPAQVGRLLRRYREFLATAQQVAADHKRSREELAVAVRQVATGKEPPALTGSAQEAIAAVVSLDGARRELESANRGLIERVATLEAQRRELLEEVAERDRRLGVLEGGGELATDERVKLYRQAFDLLEAGKSYQDVIGQVRRLDRVLTIAPKDGERLVALLDRQLADLARSLEGLRGLDGLGEDPRRYRPRLFGSKYEFKTVSGQVQALRDAGRDLRAHIERARWAASVQAFARHVPRLRAVFKELVSLVADWRAKLGDPPPVSISISMDAGSGVLALPAILAADLDGILKRRTKAGKAAEDLAPLIAAAIELYRKALTESLGELEPPSEGTKREGDISRCARLASELTDLAGRCETSLGEAARVDFRLEAADNALLAEEPNLRLTLTQLDGACGELRELGSAPEATFTGLPGRKDLGRLASTAKERVEWLELLARYRMVVGRE